MISDRAVEAIESSDTDDLLRVIDGYTSVSSWDSLVELRFRCREAVTRGKQLWGVEEHIRYRLALEAPPSFAGPVVTEGAARFALGPLAEVAARTKTWQEMDPHLAPGPERMTFAAERVARGEAVPESIADLPSSLMDWEPTYPTAAYKSDKVEAPSPKLPKVEEVELAEPGEQGDEPEPEGALTDLGQAWTDESDGRCDISAVSGSAEQAIRSLGLSRARVGQMDATHALSWMGWAGASGGAKGRRKGAAAGRYATWWVLATLMDLDWPPEPTHLGELVGGLRWLWFDDGAPATGWALRLGVEDPETGLAWAVSAVDAG